MAVHVIVLVSLHTTDTLGLGVAVVRSATMVDEHVLGRMGQVHVGAGRRTCAPLRTGDDVGTARKLHMTVVRSAATTATCVNVDVRRVNPTVLKTNVTQTY